MASEAEARLRAKVDAALRAEFPEARIFHEFYIGGCRLDLVAVGEDRMIVAEVKSERDTLERAPKQLEVSLPVAAEVWLCVHDRHLPEIQRRQQSQLIGREHFIKTRFGGTYPQNPDYVPAFNDALIRVETDDGLRDEGWRRSAYFGKHPVGPVLNSYFVLQLLWKHELLQLVKCPARWTCEMIVRHAHETLTGREIRRGVYGLIRQRPHYGASALANHLTKAG